MSEIQKPRLKYGENRTRKITFRITQESFDELESYCLANSLSKQAAIEYAIKKVLLKAED